MKKLVPVLLLTVLLTSCLKRELARGLTEQESQEVIVALEENGLRANRQQEVAEGGGGQQTETHYTVFVQGGAEQLVAAWKVLQDNGLPRSRVKGLEQIYEGSGLIPTEGEEKARLLSGLAGELARTLRSVPGVVDSRVHVVIPENSPLVPQSEWKPTTASVLLKYNGSRKPIEDAQVKEMVSKGVEGLTPDNVAVIYNHVTPKPPPARTLWWYMGNEVLLIGALILAVITTMTSLTLMVRTRMLKSQIDGLRSQLKSEDDLQLTSR